MPTKSNTIKYLEKEIETIKKLLIKNNLERTRLEGELKANENALNWANSVKGDNSVKSSTNKS